MFLIAILLPVITIFMVLHFFLHGREEGEGEGEGEVDPAVESPQHPNHHHLARFPHMLLRIRADQSPPGQCVICRRHYRPHHELTIFPGCNHVFHLRCLQLWLLSHQTCPLCRRAVNDDETSTTETSAVESAAATTDSSYEENIDQHDSANRASSSDIETIPEEPVEPEGDEYSGFGEPDVVGVEAQGEEYGSVQTEPDVVRVGAPAEEYGSVQPEPGVGCFSRCFVLVRQKRARARDPRENRADESNVAGLGPRGSISRFRRLIGSKEAQRKNGGGSSQPDRARTKCFCRRFFHFIKPKKS